MARAIALRYDFSAAELRRLARRSKDAAQARRLPALAAIYDDGTRSEAARIGNVTLQIVRDWVVRFNAEGPAGLRDRRGPGPSPLLTDGSSAGNRRPTLAGRCSGDGFARAGQRTRTPRSSRVRSDCTPRPTRIGKSARLRSVGGVCLTYGFVVD
ncbi:helix-turn-helix domain-containing protein [Roseomonas sp. CAU 1739]